MDIEKARANLSIPGYVHPESKDNNGKSSRFNKYKSYGDSKETYVSKKQDSYRLMKVNPIDFNECPKCHSESLYDCHDDDEDRQCKNGHCWHIEKGLKILTNVYRK